MSAILTRNGPRCRHMPKLSQIQANRSSNEPAAQSAARPRQNATQRRRLRDFHRTTSPDAAQPRGKSGVGPFSKKHSPSTASRGFPRSPVCSTTPRGLPRNPVRSKSHADFTGNRAPHGLAERRNRARGVTSCRVREWGSRHVRQGCLRRRSAWFRALSDRTEAAPR